MRLVLSVILLVGLVGPGCVWHKQTTAEAGSTPGSAESNAAAKDRASGQKLIVTPDHPLVGRVVSVNTVGKFVVLNFPLGSMPTEDQRLQVYRRGLKVAELKVTNLRYDDNVVADIIAGSTDVGDEARDR